MVKKRKLQVEKVRVAEEQRLNEEHLNVTEQKMTTAVHISIQKIKFLQAKLLESNRERDAALLELNNAKLSIESLHEELNQAKVTQNR